MKTTKELIIADITAKVEAKLAKIELAKHEVKLALLDEINELTKTWQTKCIPDYASIEKNRTRLFTEVKDLKNKSKIAYDLYNKTDLRTNAILKEYSALAKQLGIDVKTIEPYKKLLTISDGEITRAYKTYEFIANEVKFSF